MNAYAIETDGIGGFQVVVHRPDGGGYRTTSFLTWRAARDWVESQRRIAREIVPPGQTS